MYKHFNKYGLNKTRQKIQNPEKNNVFDLVNMLIF